MQKVNTIMNTELPANIPPRLKATAMRLIKEMAQRDPNTSLSYNAATGQLFFIGKSKDLGKGQPENPSKAPPEPAEPAEKSTGPVTCYWYISCNKRTQVETYASAIRATKAKTALTPCLQSSVGELTSGPNVFLTQRLAMNKANTSTKPDTKWVVELTFKNQAAFELVRTEFRKTLPKGTIITSILQQQRLESGEYSEFKEIKAKRPTDSTPANKAPTDSAIASEEESEGDSEESFRPSEDPSSATTTTTTAPTTDFFKVTGTVKRGNIDFSLRELVLNEASGGKLLGTGLYPTSEELQTAGLSQKR